MITGLASVAAMAMGGYGVLIVTPTDFVASTHRLVPNIDRNGTDPAVLPAV